LLYAVIYMPGLLTHVSALRKSHLTVRHPGVACLWCTTRSFTLDRLPLHEPGYEDHIDWI